MSQGDAIMQETGKKRTRELGIEILRILAMLLIVCQHFMNHGGFLKNAGENEFFLNIINVLFAPSVNVFVIISGYFSVNTRQFKPKKLAALWLQVLFYSLVMLAVSALFGAEISDATVYKSFAPVIYRKYWFFSAYIVLFLLTPYLSAMLNAITKGQHLALVLSAFICGYLSTRFEITSVFSFNYGYSIAWFALLFIIGAYLKKYPLKINRIAALAVYITSSALLLLFKYYLNDTSRLICKLIYNSTDYNQPLTLLCAICLVLIFLNISNNGTMLHKIITHLSACTFGVYLFHEAPTFRSILYNVIFETSQFHGSPIASLYVILFAVAVFIAGCAIDSIRMVMFSGVKLIINKINAALNNEQAQT